MEGLVRQRAVILADLNQMQHAILVLEASLNNPDCTTDKTLLTNKVNSSKLLVTRLKLELLNNDRRREKIKTKSL
jgi:translation elongation factor EF-Tu-like GTPase